MSTRLREYSAIASGLPTDENTVVFDKPLDLRHVLVAFAAAGHVTLHDGLTVAGPVMATLRSAGIGTVGFSWAPDDLPFKVACHVEWTSGSGIVHLYSK